VEGTLRLEGREVPVRRVDANGDGGMADPLDQLWIHWNADGTWNPFTDRLPLTPIIQVHNLRYAVRSDWVGQRLSLEKLEGSGELQLSLPKGKNKSDFLEVALVLLGRDGSIAKLDLAQDKVQVPVGEYSPYELSAVVKDPAGGEPWAFVFGRTIDWAGMVASPGYAVKPNSRVAVNPLAGLTLTAALGKNDLPCRPGGEITVRPRLATADSLSLRDCYRSDKPDSSKRHPGVEIRMMTTGGKASGTDRTLAVVRSGFT
jgi:hypothetical protein